jgi:hypothetical protein
MTSYTVDSVPGVLFEFTGYKVKEDGTHDYSYGMLKPIGKREASEPYPILQIHAVREDDK